MRGDKTNRAVIPFAMLVTLVVTACDLVKEKSRVAVPGTNLTVVLGEDEKQMDRYWVLVDGKRASDEGFLGPPDRDASNRADVSVHGTRVTVTWRGGLSSHFVEIDVAECRITRHSNAVARVPSIQGCVGGPNLQRPANPSISSTIP